jgi:serine protease Do
MQQQDLILEIGGKPVYDRYDLMLHVGRAGPETETKVRVWREKLRRELDLTVHLGKWPVRNEEEIIATVPRYPAWRGLSVDFPTGRYKYFPFPVQIPQAVLVTSVEPQSSAAAAELQAGDFVSHVNGTPVETPAEFQQAIRQAEGDATLQLEDGRRIVVGP